MARIIPIFAPTALLKSTLVGVGTGLSWEKLTHTFEFIKTMTQNWEN